MTGHDEAVTPVPEARYALSGGVHLAYQVIGQGPIDVLFALGLPLSIDSLWDSSTSARFLRRLSSFARVIMFDRRGVGMSDPVSPGVPPTSEQLMEDALVVLTEAGAHRVPVVGADHAGAQVGILLAATHPRRVSHLVVVNGTARYAWAPDYPFGERDPAVPAVDATRSRWHWLATEDGMAMVLPSAAGDEEFRNWWRRSVSRSFSPAVARALVLNRNMSDVRAALPSVSVPTLVVHRNANRYVPAGHGRYIADQIPSARYVELEGEDQLVFAGDQDAILDEVQEFLTGQRPAPELDRVLATILFTDIVGSTEALAERGDRSWRDAIERHDSLVRRQIERFRGRDVDTTGDGVLATFDGPARAIRCAEAIRDVVHSLGVEVRAGLHTGEVERRGPHGGIAGIAVHVAQRVSSLAGPGEILVSRTVTDLVAGSGLEFEDRGEHDLKGVPGRWRLFGVRS